MSMNVGKEVAALQRMTVNELRARYAAVFGDETRTGNKAWLVKRIAWRLQATAEGGLSERARQRAEELANDADIRMSPPKPKPATPPNEQRTVTAAIRFADDDRLPLAGTVLTRDYKGSKRPADHVGRRGQAGCQWLGSKLMRSSCAVVGRRRSRSRR